MPPALPPNSYDALPYQSFPYRNTHPEHLAVVATLLGLKPPSPDRCRVLELGCAGGGNLIPMALALPNSQFVGVDLSAVQIAQGNKTVKTLDLRNIELHQRSILDIGPESGLFDYVICHGVYSWVPRAVQEKILDICSNNLQPDGIACISYNTYPGWYMRGMIRDMMRYHVSRFPDDEPEQAVARSRQLLDFLANSCRQQESPYGLLLRQELALLTAHSDAYLFHEHLEDCNEPTYFLQFCDRLPRHGLRYLGESEFHLMVPGTTFPPEVQETLAEMAPDLQLREQYMDFLRNRQFRISLLCQGDRRPSYEVRGEQLASFRIASRLKPATVDANLNSAEPLEFRSENGLVLTSSTPIVKAAIALLGEIWPLSLPFDELVGRAAERLGVARDSDGSRAGALGRSLLTAYATAGESLIELSLLAPCFATQLSSTPRASNLARLQAETAAQVTNMRHERVNLTQFDRHLLRLLDGTRDRPAFLEGLLQHVAAGELTLTAENGEAITDAESLKLPLSQAMNQQLPWLARMALLVG